MCVLGECLSINKVIEHFMQYTFYLCSEVGWGGGVG